MRMEELKKRFRKKALEASPWGQEKEKTGAYPVEEYRLKLLKMPRSVVSRRWFTGGGLLMSLILSGLCVAGQAGFIAVFFLMLGFVCFDYYRFLGRLKVES